MRFLQIFGYGSPLAKLTESFRTKVEKCGFGLLSRWSPQQTILIHKVSLFDGSSTA